MSDTIVENFAYAIVIVLLDDVRKQSPSRQNTLVKIPDLWQSFIDSQDERCREMFVVNFLVMLINKHPGDGSHGRADQVGGCLFA